ncbi:MAG TPA: hypothetical protein VFJ97_15475 [Dermatophilaceae bacterium]|nr:hypothetical protein [Dermatophilaceae bacterium]
MTELDPFALYDAAYVLGALNPQEREAYVVHLRTCAACSAAVAELAGMPGLLGLVPAEVAAAQPDDDEAAEAGEPPDLLAVITARLNAERAAERAAAGRLAAVRRRRLVGAVAALAAACLAAGALVLPRLWPEPGPATPPVAGPGLQLRSAPSGAAAASAGLTDVAWGTKITLRCAYADDDAIATEVFALIVRDRQGRSTQVATWRGVPGRTITVNAAASNRTAEIADLVIAGPGAQLVLRSG